MIFWVCHLELLTKKDCSFISLNMSNRQGPQNLTYLESTGKLVDNHACPLTTRENFTQTPIEK